MDLGLQGRSVLVTGGSQGIGLAIARAFIAEGCSALLVSRDSAKLDGAVATLPNGAARAVVADLSRAEERARIAELHGDADILVNNAGAMSGGGLLDITMETWETSFALKVTGYVHLTQLFLARMKARGEGVIVNVIGLGGQMPRYDYVCGSTGNAALMAFTGAVGGASPDWGVRVFGVNPAITRTDRAVSLARRRAQSRFGDAERWQEMFAGLPMSRPAEPDEIARTTVFLASPACGYVSGATVDVDGGTVFR